MAIVVGDLHGKIDKLEKILKEFNGELFYFVGDYLDSFDESIDNQLEVLGIVMNLAAENKAVSLLGNHELSYFSPKYLATGYKSETHLKLKEKFYFNFMLTTLLSVGRDEYIKYLNFPLSNEGFLISHAGFSKTWVDSSLEDFVIGRARGGSAVCGGPLWCDFRNEFVELPDVRQVFGHTRVKEITRVGDSWCIDCLDYVNQVLEISEGYATVRRFE